MDKPITVETSLNDALDSFNTTANRIADERNELLSALKAITPPYPDKGASCHRGICSQKQCAHCKRIKTAHNAIAKAEGIS